MASWRSDVAYRPDKIKAEWDLFRFTTCRFDWISASKTQRQRSQNARRWLRAYFL